MEWNGKLNFRSYDQVESLSNYTNGHELESYRKERLDKYRVVVDFLKQHNFEGGLRVVEIGSGSSALLYALEQEGILVKGVGIELSKTRYEFAEKWRKDDMFSNVENVNGDFSDVNLPQKSFDCFLVIDNTFTYLYPEDPLYPAMLIKKAFDLLTDEGILVLEMHNYLPIIAKISCSGCLYCKDWKELPKTNMFKYSLYRHDYNREQNTLRTESIYITDAGTEKRKVEFSYIYNLMNLGSLLQEHGFEITENYTDFLRTPFKQESSLDLVIVARKKL